MAFIYIKKIKKNFAQKKTMPTNKNDFTTLDYIDVFRTEAGYL
jgi:hypothetical protein